MASVESRLDKVGAEKGVTFDYAEAQANDQFNLNGGFVQISCWAGRLSSYRRGHPLPPPSSCGKIPTSLRWPISGFRRFDGRAVTGKADALNTEAIMNLITAINPDIDTIGLLYDWKDASCPGHRRCQGVLRQQGHQVH